MRLVRPRPYRVSYEETTPDEPKSGWYWGYDDDEGDHIKGPYWNRREAEDAIDSFMFSLGEPL